MEDFKCPICILEGIFNKIVKRGNFYLCENLNCFLIEDEESIKLLQNNTDKIEKLDSETLKNTIQIDQNIKIIDLEYKSINDNIRENYSLSTKDTFGYDEISNFKNKNEFDLKLQLNLSNSENKSIICHIGETLKDSTNGTIDSVYTPTYNSADGSVTNLQFQTNFIDSENKTIADNIGKICWNSADETMNINDTFNDFFADPLEINQESDNFDDLFNSFVKTCDDANALALIMETNEINKSSNTLELNNADISKSLEETMECAGSYEISVDKEYSNNGISTKINDLINPITALNNILQRHSYKSINWTKLLSGMKAHDVILCILIVNFDIINTDYIEEVRREYKVCEALWNNFNIDKAKLFSFNFISKLFDMIIKLPLHVIAKKDLDERLFLSLSENIKAVDRLKTVNYNENFLCSSCDYSELNEKCSYFIETEKIVKISCNEIKYTSVCPQCKDTLFKTILINSAPKNIMLQCSDGISTDMNLSSAIDIIIGYQSFKLVGVVECNEKHPYLDSIEERITLDCYKHTLSNYLDKPKYLVHFRDNRGWFTIDQKEDFTIYPTEELVIENAANVKLLIFGNVKESNKYFVEMTTADYLQRLAVISENSDFISKNDILNDDALNIKFDKRGKKRGFEIDTISSCKMFKKGEFEINTVVNQSKRSYKLASKVDLDEDDDISIVNDKGGYVCNAVTSSGVSSSSSVSRKELSIHSRRTASQCTGSTLASHIESLSSSMSIDETPFSLDKLINLYVEKISKNGNEQIINKVMISPDDKLYKNPTLSGSLGRFSRPFKKRVRKSKI